MVELVVSATPPQAGDLVAVARVSGPPDGMVDVTIVHQNVQTGAAYLLTSGDAAHWVIMQAAGGSAVTLPTDATDNVPIGSATVIARDQGAGIVTITAAAGATLNGVAGGSVTIVDEAAAGTVVKVGADAWKSWGLGVAA